MGIIFSCCREDSSDEDEALLREHQSGYGGVDESSEYEDRLSAKILKEQEQKLQQRNEELREIVENLNGKLIDISMVSNSDIVVQSSDLDDTARSQLAEQKNNDNYMELEQGQDAGQVQYQENEQLQEQVRKHQPTISQLDSKTLTSAMRGALKTLHDSIFSELDDSLTKAALKNTKELTMSL
ncbi:hypothetical protein TPHA_0G03410 [Tetrapisispora phaffii CBS 4417]|uniref:Uncharacterized protein n=1 Tax=Tetrapisispora phaffii (strain ATCC 24235 / CBS 4417 / NBRC 1672 / NRRL Y-8282 / UCD 70-5) TaxID=1071381 RepID=G8BWA3_TETPH|nr:hypothetical protein TPHA_0G03410 [Tetrapisispora phaffii CBS 4417]CCE64181.1 hypothetical protein TPHA_0G03410 [Tetrapisispora phaffii CBS 4417]